MKPLISLLLAVATLMCSACTSPSEPVVDPTPPDPTPPVKETGFARGADVSWLTQMEAEGLKFFTPAPYRREMECMKLLRDSCGINSIRLRVWVNPANGWNAIPDVVAKAKRAENLGLRTMIDFHFSDTWADPGHQEIPAAWKGLALTDMCTALATHVTETLTALKAAGVTPEWVQVGNETTPGMLLPMGSCDKPAQYVQLHNAGYHAVKAIFPDAKVIIHLDRGNERALYDWTFDNLTRHNARYDIIGMSLYPYWAQEQNLPGGWTKIVDDCVANITHLRQKYNKPVMMCEIGMPYNKPDLCSQLITRLMTTPLEGIFYWEPQAPAGYNGGYNMGCFDNSAPTHALDPFKTHRKQ